MVDNVFFQGAPFDEYGFDLMREKFPKQYAEYMKSIRLDHVRQGVEKKVVNKDNQGCPFDA